VLSTPPLPTEAPLCAPASDGALTRLLPLPLMTTLLSPWRLRRGLASARQVAAGDVLAG